MLTLVAPSCETVPVPSALRVVVPVIDVLPIAMLPLDPPAAIKLSPPPVTVPEAVIVPPFAESLTVKVPVPTFEVWTTVETVSVTDVVPETAVALMNPALVLLIVAPPEPLTSDNVPVETFVAPD